ncbi:hypothetical protein IVB41_21890 [Bradyrhizobium sp. 44]|uniref:hypothetical protein n=1 Tax=Bradyrhizobium sp. 44 TaxID=2782675 RepID=UPI001FF9F397|nr:hypothetical protein [Bradyrhizobium sp. 44]MCK1286576.1 hypothetical protein [Bradyrhizobium sp. 44]
MSKFRSYVGYSHVFADQEGHRYLSGYMHPTAQAAIDAISKNIPKGTPVTVVQVVWDEAEDAPYPPWSAKS